MLVNSSEYLKQKIKAQFTQSFPEGRKKQEYFLIFYEPAKLYALKLEITRKIIEILQTIFLNNMDIKILM